MASGARAGLFVVPHVVTAMRDRACAPARVRREGRGAEIAFALAIFSE